MLTLVSLLVFVLVGCIVWWAVTKLLAAFGVGDPLATVVQVIVVLLLLALLLNYLGIVDVPLRR